MKDQAGRSQGSGFFSLGSQSVAEVSLSHTLEWRGYLASPGMSLGSSDTTGSMTLKSASHRHMTMNFIFKSLNKSEMRVMDTFCQRIENISLTNIKCP
jgi:hypothetical protein